MTTSVAKRVAELRKEVERHNRLYYDKATPEISDFEFDRLLKELADLEKAHPELASAESPTQRVGEATTEGFRKVEHAQPMYSIDNTYNEEDLRSWDEGLKKRLDGENPTYVCEPKVDGVAISLRYEKSVLVYALTRGDGRRGDDVTVNVKTIKSVPHQLTPAKKAAGKTKSHAVQDDASLFVIDAGQSAGLPDVIEVRGEVYMENADFDALNAQHRAAEAERLRIAQAKGKTIAVRPDYANPRNFTTGTLKQKDASITASRPLKFVAHGFGEVVPPMPDSYYDAVLQIAALGLPTSRATKQVKDIDEAIKTIRAFEAERKTLPYNTDGMVVKVDSKQQRDVLGYTSKSPRWVIAYKYPADQVETTLNDVTWQVGKAGTLTPVAEMEPVLVAGTTVRRATLHNIANIEKLNLHFGDRVTIEKAGEIIPQVIKADETKRDSKAKPVKAPKKCPSCGAPVEREPDGPHIFCENPACPAQLLERLKHFAGRKQMNIDGLGERLIEQLIDAGKLASIPDIYRLTADDIANLESETTRVNKDGEVVTSIRKVGQKTAENIMRSIEASKDRGLASALASLGARFLGHTNGRKLAAWAGDIDKLFEATTDELREAIRDADAEGDSDKGLRTFAELLAEKIQTAAGAGGATDVETLLEELKSDSKLSRRLNEERTNALVARFSTVHELAAASEQELFLALRKGVPVPEVLRQFFASESGRALIEGLRKAGVRLNEKRDAAAKVRESEFTGKSVVITGSFEGLTREEMADRFRTLGAKVGSGVSSKTDYLIAGADAGDKKTSKAAELGVKVIGVDEVDAILKKHFGE